MDVSERADLGVMLGHIIARRNTSGAEAEAQRAWGIDGNQIPVAMLTELRTIDAPDDGQGSSFVGYVFGESIASFANVARPTVPSGTIVYPSFTSGVAATRPAIDATNADVDPVMRGELLSPKRVQANTSISIEDRARFPGMGAAVAAHLRGAVVKGLDAMALEDNNGFFDITAGPLTPQNDPGSATTIAQYLAMLSDGVDGRHARGPADVGLIVGKQTYTDGAALYRTNQAPDNIMDQIARTGRLMVSDSIPAAASNIQFILRVLGTRQSAVQPLWPGIDIEDIYSDSKKGVIAFTALLMAGFSVQDPSGLQLSQIQRLLGGAQSAFSTLNTLTFSHL